jgi:hypothetical protein
MVGSVLSKVFERVQACPAPHPAGFNDDRAMIGAALDLASTTLNLAPDEMLSPASPIMESLASFALAAMDASYDRLLAPYITGFFASLMVLGKLPREELVASRGGGAGGALLPTPTAGSSGSGVAQHEQARQRDAERRARRPRVLAIMTRIAEPLTKSIIKAVIKTWPDYSIRYHEGREGLGDVLHMLFTQYFPEINASPTGTTGSTTTGNMPQWALQTFQEDGMCVERGKPTDAEKVALVGKLFAINEGGSQSHTMATSDRFYYVLLEMHDAARGILRQPYHHQQQQQPTPSSGATASSGPHTYPGYSPHDGDESGYSGRPGEDGDGDYEEGQDDDYDHDEGGY